MHVVHALAPRRAAVAAAALGASVGAHVAAMGGAHLTAAAPPLWAILLLGAAICGPRRRFLPRSLIRTATLLIALQAVLHVAMTTAPWAFGMQPHGAEAAMVDARAVVVHGAAAVVLALVLRGLDRALAAALAVVRRLVRGLLRVSAAGTTERAAGEVSAPRARAVLGRLPARGPPRPPRPVLLATA